jgi:hypothetical protein
MSMFGSENTSGRERKTQSTAVAREQHTSEYWQGQAKNRIFIATLLSARVNTHAVKFQPISSNHMLEDLALF